MFLHCSLIGVHPQGLLLAQTQFWMPVLCICSIPKTTACFEVPSEWLSRHRRVCSKAYQLWISFSMGNQVLRIAFPLMGILHWDAKPTLWIWIYHSLDRWDLCLGRVQLNCCGLKWSWNKNKGSDAMLCWSLTGAASIVSQPSVAQCLHMLWTTEKFHLKHCSWKLVRASDSERSINPHFIR